MSTTWRFITAEVDVEFKNGCIHIGECWMDVTILNPNPFVIGISPYGILIPPYCSSSPGRLLGPIVIDKVEPDKSLTTQRENEKVKA